MRAYILEGRHAGREMGQQSRGPSSRRRRRGTRTEEGDEIEIHVADAREFAVARKPGREELLKRLRAFRGRLRGDFIFDREDVSAR